MDQMYEDKLDGKIDNEFWSRKMNEWREQERTLESELSRLKIGITDESMFTVREILELANQHVLCMLRGITQNAGKAARFGLKNEAADQRCKQKCHDPRLRATIPKRDSDRRQCECSKRVRQIEVVEHKLQQ